MNASSNQHSINDIRSILGALSYQIEEQNWHMRTLSIGFLFLSTGVGLGIGSWGFSHILKLTYNCWRRTSGNTSSGIKSSDDTSSDTSSRGSTEETLAEGEEEICHLKCCKYCMNIKRNCK